ncbi:MAG: T9SS type A sorting domain-containing protein [Sphingobacteriales bacterium JAD_PAG50586_3]|nr:MAG: T9SS type A sorting domain-containing protein [Sphingobacteriales bacterium JAD_PAG50586_3]
MKLILTYIILFVSCMVYGQAGMLDNSFSNDGKFTFANLNTSQCQAMSVGIQPDGKIVLLGTQLITFPIDFIVMRANTDGSIDQTFGNNGVVISNISGDDSPHKILALPDGKLVAVGYTGDFDFSLIKYNYNGTIDSTFGNNGITTTDLLSGSVDLAVTALLQPDGKIVAGGYTTQNNQQDFALARYNVDRTLDTLFGNNGIVVSNIINLGNDIIAEICLAPNGKIIAVGSTNKFYQRPIVAMYTNSGDLDLTFGPGNKGYIIDSSNPNNSSYVSVASEPDGRFVVCSRFNVKRYLSSGFVDTTYGENGSSSSGFGVYEYVSFTKILTRAEGKYLLCGHKSDWADFLAVGLDENGFVDSLEYGVDGFMGVDFDSNHDYCYDAIFQQDGKLVMVGGAEETTNKFAAIRLLGDLTIGLVEFSLTEPPPLLYPNPLQNTEHLKYTLAEDNQISIALFDSQGKMVTTFVENEKQPKGYHEVELILPTNLPSGTYFIQIASPKGKISIKAIK